MALTVAQAQDRVTRLIPYLAQRMTDFQTGIKDDLQSEFGVERYLQFKITDPLLEDATGISGLAIDIYSGPSGHGWSARMNVSAEGRYFYRIWDMPNPPETRATGAWIETDINGEPLEA